MSKINDGGPVYPVVQQSQTDNGVTYYESLTGKSLRADFAGIFMAAMIANGGTVSIAEDRIGSRMSGVAVALADTLIAELNKEPK